MADDCARCLDAGMNLYLAKPTSLASLSAALVEAAATVRSSDRN
jgi:CheY-like chemotaxis protein